jgi:hypothetical protein
MIERQRKETNELIENYNNISGDRYLAADWKHYYEQIRTSRIENDKELFTWAEANPVYRNWLLKQMEDDTEFQEIMSDMFSFIPPAENQYSSTYMAADNNIAVGRIDKSPTGGYIVFEDADVKEISIGVTNTIVIVRSTEDTEAISILYDAERGYDMGYDEDRQSIYFANPAVFDVPVTYMVVSLPKDMPLENIWINTNSGVLIEDVTGVNNLIIRDYAGHAFINDTMYEFNTVILNSNFSGVIIEANTDVVVRDSTFTAFNEYDSVEYVELYGFSYTNNYARDAAQGRSISFADSDTTGFKIEGNHIRTEITESKIERFLQVGRSWENTGEGVVTSISHSEIYDMAVMSTGLDINVQHSIIGMISAFFIYDREHYTVTENGIFSKHINITESEVGSFTIPDNYESQTVPRGLWHDLLAE